jgi:uncharacterized paraquat-inducible protein A
MDEMFDYFLYEAFIALSEGVTLCPECEMGIIIQLDAEQMSAMCDTCGQEFLYH